MPLPIPDPLPELRKVRRIDRRSLLEHRLTREELHVRVLHPARNNVFVAQVVNDLQKHPPHHLPERNHGTAVV